MKQDFETVKWLVCVGEKSFKNGRLKNIKKTKNPIFTGRLFISFQMGFLL